MYIPFGYMQNYSRSLLSYIIKRTCIARIITYNKDNLYSLGLSYIIQLLVWLKLLFNKY